MKRHISIFAFLLGAFAAGLASEAGASQTVYGGYYYIGEGFEGRSFERMTVNKIYMQAVLAKGASATCAVNQEPDGTKVSDWGYVKGDSGTKVQTFANLTWEDDSSREYPWENETDSPDKVAIAVRFDYINYTLKFASSQGGTMPADIVTTYEKQVTVPAPSSAPTGYHFVKWIATSSFDAGLSKDVSDGSSLNGEGFGLAGCHADGSVITLTAQWAENTYTVTFDENGGGSPNPSSKTVTYGSTYGDLATCSRTGYTFDGWWTAASGGTKIETTTKVTITGAQTLYAHWAANEYTVTVKPNGGTGGSCPKYTVSTVQQTKTVTKPTRTGYWISGWTVTGATGGTPTVSESTLTIPANVYGNLTLEPTWTPVSYTISYSGLKEGSTHSGNPTSYTIESNDITFNAASDTTAYKFNGWSPASIAKGSTGNLTVTANYLTKVDNPVAKTPLIYNGSVQSCASSTTRYQAKDNQQTVPGQYTVTFTLYDGYCWSKDGSVGPYSVPWEIQKANLTDLSVGQSGSLTYTGEEQTPVINAQARAQGGQAVIWEYSASGSAFSTVVPSFKDAGTYTVYYRVNAQYHNQVSGTFSVTIERAKTASVDVSPSELPYTKKEQGPAVTIRNCMTSGDLRATDIGTYRIKATPKTNYAWPNGGMEERTFEWSIVDSSYTIEFDGAGGSGSMEPVTLVRDEPYVVANAFTKKGCEFVTWRTVIGGVATNFDVGVTVSNLTSEAGAHLTFTADWLGRYTVAFDRNGGEGTMTNVMYEADREYLLPSNAFTKSGHHFIGWATNRTDVVFTNCAAVSNLVAPGETCTLVAQWKQISLGEAMHCNDTNLVWKSSPGNNSYVNPWEPFVGMDVGDGTDSCARQKGGTSQQWLVAYVVTNGSLSFSWKPTDCNGKLTFWIGPEEDQFNENDLVDLTGNDGSWSTFSTNGIPAGSWIHIYFYSSVGICDIDRMTWTPEGAHPEPEDGKDNVTISSAAVSGGKFTLSFKSDAKFDYNLLTNANLLINSWGVMGEKKTGDGKILTFEPQIIEGQPQMFYRVETIQKKD